MCIIATHMYVCTPHSYPVPMEVRRVNGSPGIGATSESLCGCWKLNQGPL